MDWASQHSQSGSQSVCPSDVVSEWGRECVPGRCAAFRSLLSSDSVLFGKLGEKLEEAHLQAPIRSGWKWARKLWVVTKNKSSDNVVLFENLFQLQLIHRFSRILFRRVPRRPPTRRSEWRMLASGKLLGPWSKWWLSVQRCSLSPIVSGSTFMNFWGKCRRRPEPVQPAVCLSFCLSLHLCGPNELVLFLRALELN